MRAEESKDPLKEVDWKAIGSELQKDPGAGVKPVVKKRLPKKIRQIPDYYFLPRRSLPSAIAFYGSCIAGGIGAGMLLEIWINKKVKGSGTVGSCDADKVKTGYRKRVTDNKGGQWLSVMTGGGVA
ncbi:hypothetical protein KPL70_009971 [Citrus sinensis]|nr:hypothetical protein KPL70_009971 [Citrus sinensis]